MTIFYLPGFLYQSNWGNRSGVDSNREQDMTYRTKLNINTSGLLPDSSESPERSNQFDVQSTESDYAVHVLLPKNRQGDGGLKPCLRWKLSLLSLLSDYRPPKSTAVHPQGDAGQSCAHLYNHNGCLLNPELFGHGGIFTVCCAQTPPVWTQTHSSCCLCAAQAENVKLYCYI